MSGLTGLVATSTTADTMDAKHIAEGIAQDAYMNYHRARLQLPEGQELIDQLRKYTVIDRGEVYAIVYRDGFDAGMPKIHATVNKATNAVCLN